MYWEIYAKESPFAPHTHLLLLTPQLLHSMLFTHRAMVEQLAGQRTPGGLPEASGDKKGSSSLVHREYLGPGRAQRILS